MVTITCAAASVHALREKFGSHAPHGGGSPWTPSHATLQSLLARSHPFLLAVCHFRALHYILSLSAAFHLVLLACILSCTGCVKEEHL